MKHYIIVKYNDLVSDASEVERQIKALFAPAAELDGIHSVSVHPAVMHSRIRFDLMIRVDMNRESLVLFDASDIHKQWKTDFAHLIAHKVIFDCD
ncbi:MAG: hypothetical protein GX096_14440 [Clostridiales bacterium]|nr:hypothetical protein [Clostridiales bacterium]